MSEGKKINDIGVFVIDRETSKGLLALTDVLFDDELGKKVTAHIQKKNQVENLKNFLNIVSETVHKNNWCDDPECEYTPNPLNKQKPNNEQ